MKVLLDQGVPRSAAEVLRQADCDVVHTGEVGLARADDEEILNWAKQEERIVVTLDADFHRILALNGEITPSVVRIREQGLDGQAVASLLQQIVERCQAELNAGALVTVQNQKARVRRLPIVPPDH